MRHERRGYTAPTGYHWLMLAFFLTLAALVLWVWSPAVLGPKGARPYDAGSVSRKSPFPNELANPAGFRLQTEAPEYPADTGQLNIVLFNDTDDGAAFGMPYALEIFRDGGWYSVPFRKLPDGVVRAWLAYATPLPAHSTRTDTISLAEHEPLAAGNYRLIKDILLDGQPGINLAGRTRTVWCPFTVTEPVTAGLSSPVPDRREPDVIDGCLFAIDLLMQKADRFSGGAKWLAVDTASLSYLTDENKTRFFEGLECYGLLLQEKARAELAGEGLIRQGRFDKGLLVEFMVMPTMNPRICRMEFWTRIWRSDQETHEYKQLSIAFVDGRWVLSSDLPYRSF